MKKGLMELIFVVDRSGSMYGLESDTIGGFNSMLTKQQEENGEAVVTTMLFDDNIQLLHDRLDINSIAPLTSADYQLGGGTALLDALGTAMHKVRKAHESMKEEFRPEKTIFFIITDGQENSSKHYSFDMIKERVQRYNKEKGWEFIFFGANIDTIYEAGKLGIGANMSYSFTNDPMGVVSTWNNISRITGTFRRK